MTIDSKMPKAPDSTRGGRNDYGTFTTKSLTLLSKEQHEKITKTLNELDAQLREQFRVLDKLPSVGSIISEAFEDTISRGEETISSISAKMATHYKNESISTLINQVTKVWHQFTTAFLEKPFIPQK